MKKNVSGKIIKALHGLRGNVLAGTVLLLTTLASTAGVYNVNVSSYTLYTDVNYPALKIKMGGFSGLHPVPGTEDQFWTVTDRGPTQDIVTPDEVTHKVLPCATMSPMIVRLEIRGSIVRVLETIPLKKFGGHKFLPIMPWANGTEIAPEVLEDIYYNPLPFDPDGLDPEGITMDPWGNFWICEEYRPSIAMVNKQGVVVLRLVPQGTLKGTEMIPTYDILPKVLTKRVNNRGMEGIAFTPNGRIYAVVQRPLANPKKANSEASVNLRLVEVDLLPFLAGTGAPQVRQLIYQGESVDAKVYASDLWAVSNTEFLVPERKTDKLFAIDISMATDITGFEDENGVLTDGSGKTIEQLDLAGLTALGISPVVKVEILPSLTAYHKELAKCEGLCVVGGNIVMVYDNDFNLGDFGDGNFTPGSIGLKPVDVYPAVIMTPVPTQ